MNHQIVETGIEKIERVLNQQMRVLNAMQVGKSYRSAELVVPTGLRVTRVRTALAALRKAGMVQCISSEVPHWPFGPFLYWQKVGLS